MVIGGYDYSLKSGCYLWPINYLLIGVRFEFQMVFVSFRLVLHFIAQTKNNQT